MWHGCKQAISCDIAGKVCCAKQVSIFQCHSECTDGQMPHMYLPDAGAAVSRYFVHSFGHCGIHQGVCNISIPCCMHVNFCAVLSKDAVTDSHQCAEAVFPHIGILLGSE